MRIGGVDVEAAAKRLEGMTACENEASRKNNTAVWLSRPAVLRTCGLSESRDRAEYTIATPEGGERTVELEVMAPGVNIDWVMMPARDAAGLADSRQPRTDWYGSKMLGDGVMYVWYDRCAEQREPGVRSVGRTDARDNRSGETATRDHRSAAQRRREQRDFSGPLWTGWRSAGCSKQARRGRWRSVGRGTFSSGMMNAMDLKRGGATLVGEPTGQKPNAFGEVKTFTLPRSGWVVQYSTKEWRLAPEGDPESLMPDVRAETGSAEFFAGRDVALEAAIAYEAGK